MSSPALIPKSSRRTPRPDLACYCKWCAARGLRRHFFKLRDGPLDWYFSNDEHALEWLEHRHKSTRINAVLKLCPQERARVLQGMSIERFCSVELSQGDGM